MQQPSEKLAELEAALLRFPLRHMAEHALPELGASWEWALRMLQRCRLPVRVSTLAPVLRDRVHQQGLRDEQLQAIIDTLSLKCVALNESQEWHAYKLHKRTAAADEPVHAALAQAPRRVERALLAAYPDRACNIQVKSVLVGEWIYLAVHEGRRSLHAAALPAANYVFTSRRSVPARLMTALATGLGWSGARSSELSGRHLASLLHVLQQHVNGAARALLPPEEYAPAARRLPHGLDCTGDAYSARYAGEIIGAEPPQLRRLETSVEAPYCLEEDAALLRVGVRLLSEDVAGTLRDLVRVKAIAGNSQWLHAFRSTRTNCVDLDEMDE